MSRELIEKLPGGLALFNIPFEEPISAGQWLIGDNQQFPVFHHANDQAQIIANQQAALPLKFTVCGTALEIEDKDQPLLLLADNQAVTLLLFLINQLRQQWGDHILRSRIHRIFLGTATVFPFKAVPSRFILDEIPAGTIASAQLLEDLALPARLASEAELPGCFPGSLSHMLQQLNFDNFFKDEPLIITIGTSALLDDIKKLFTGRPGKQLLINFES